MLIVPRLLAVVAWCFLSVCKSADIVRSSHGIVDDMGLIRDLDWRGGCGEREVQMPQRR